MKAKFLLYFFFFLSLNHCVYSQSKTIQIEDAVNQNPIQFATVQLLISNRVVFADSLGRFQLANYELNTLDTLLISRMGYLLKKFPISYFNKMNTTKVFLTPQNINLTEFSFVEETPITFLKQVRSKLKLGVPLSSFKLNGFYRQYHWENGKVVFLVEAANEVYFASNKNSLERVKINEIRRALITEKNKEVHADHFVDLLKANPVYHLLGNIFNSTVDHNIVYHFRELDKDSSQFEWLEFSVDEKLFDVLGWIIVRKNDNAILKYRMHKTRKANSGMDSKSTGGKFIWLKQEELIEAEFIWVNDSVYPSMLHQQYNHYLIQPDFNSVEFELKEDFFWVSVDSIVIVKSPFQEFKFSSNLYTSKYIYNRYFWHDYNAIKLYPLNEFVKESLTERVLLEKQFLDAGR